MSRYDQAENKKTTGVIIGVVALLLAGGAWYYVSQQSQPVQESETKPLALPPVSEDTSSDESAFEEVLSDQADAESIEENEQALPEQAAVLPELSSSDQAFSKAVVAVSPQLSPWFKSNQLIRKYTVIVNDFSQGILLEKHMRFLKQSQPFSVDKIDDGLVMAEDSYRRYDKLAAAIDAIDAKEAMSAYRKFKPLLLEVFDEFGYPPERPLEDIFLKASSQILAAPILEQPVALVRPSVVYKYADEKLEQLSPVSKQMLRMGPKNTRIIQNKVRQLVQELVNDKEQATR